MRRDVVQLRAFYTSPLGRAARTLVGGKLAETWGDVRALDLLGVGYATPYLEAFGRDPHRVAAAMPAAQGVEHWPAGGANLSCLAEDGGLPFPNALFDRVLAVHALEESADPAALVSELKRVLAASGRLILVVANRRGVWARAESTPFGHGRPFSREQLEQQVRDAGLEPAAWSRALYLPPLAMAAPHAAAFERVGARLWTALSGVILLEAVKQGYAVRPRGAVAPARVPKAIPAAPVPATRSAETMALRVS